MALYALATLDALALRYVLRFVLCGGISRLLYGLRTWACHAIPAGFAGFVVKPKGIYGATVIASEGIVSIHMARSVYV